MNATRQLHHLGQSLWLDNITRELLTSGTLRRYINELSVTGLTSNPTIFEHALNDSDCYDSEIERWTRAGKAGEALFFELALEDLCQAADLLLPIHAATDGVDGWVSLEVSPMLAFDPSAMFQAAIDLNRRAARPNLLIKIPGTRAGIKAIEETIFAGVPVNVTLLFSPEHYLAAANAYLSGIERRISADLDPNVVSVASIFISRWDVAVIDKVPQEMRNHLGIAIAMQAYKAYRDMLISPRWQRLENAGARPQRLLWASTGTKDPQAAETLYIEALAAPDTINTMPEKSLLAFANYGEVTTCLPSDGGDVDARLEAFARIGIDIAELAETLQQEGTMAFAKSWSTLLARLALQRDTFQKTSRSLV
ncbi:MAG: transaldolase [Gammaproteobacteria bacterium]|jgi:transaldolase